MLTRHSIWKFYDGISLACQASVLTIMQQHSLRSAQHSTAQPSPAQPSPAQPSPAQHSAAQHSTGWGCKSPAGLSRQAHREVGDHSPDEGHQQGVGDALQGGREGKGEGVEEHHAPLLPEHRQPLHLCPHTLLSGACHGSGCDAMLLSCVQCISLTSFAALCERDG